MHKGSMLATFACAGLILGVAAWMMLSPLLTRSYSAVLRDPASGARVACRVSFAPGFTDRAPERALAICEMRCEEEGYRLESGPGEIIDFVSVEASRRAQAEYRAFVPPACRARSQARHSGGRLPPVSPLQR